MDDARCSPASSCNTARTHADYTRDTGIRPSGHGEALEMGSTTDPLSRRRATLQRLFSCERRWLLEAALVSRRRAELNASSGLIERLLECTAAAAAGSYR
jgi:hypothetical protein